MYVPEANKIRLEPVPEYPFDFEKKQDEEVTSLQPDLSPYGEDGSLEVFFIRVFYSILIYSSRISYSVLAYCQQETSNEPCELCF